MAGSGPDGRATTTAGLRTVDAASLYIRRDDSTVPLRARVGGDLLQSAYLGAGHRGGLRSGAAVGFVVLRQSAAVAGDAAAGVEHRVDPGARVPAGGGLGARCAGVSAGGRYRYR